MEGNRAVVDLDGTISDYAESLLTAYPALTTEELVLWMQGARDHNMYPALRSNGYDKMEPSIFMNAKPYPGAIFGMSALTRMYDRVSIVTLVNSGEAAEAKSQWLYDHKIPYDELLTRPLTFDKGNVMAQLYIEDSPHQLMSCRIKHPEARTILFRRLWNMYSKDFETVSTWRGLTELLEREK